MHSRSPEYRSHAHFHCCVHKPAQPDIALRTICAGDGIAAVAMLELPGYRPGLSRIGSHFPPVRAETWVSG